MNKEFEINTGIIFQDIQNDWQKFNRNFLITLEEPLRNTLRKNKICTVSGNKNDEYIRNYDEIRYPTALEIALNKKQFPFPHYFLNRVGNNSNTIQIINYSEKCAIKYGEDYFDLFFTLKFYLSDIMQADLFLKFHLETSFSGDISEYSSFLKKLILKYQELLNQKHIPLIHAFLNQNNTIEIITGNKEFTTSRQVLAVHYLLKELIAPNSENKIEIARFIQFLTGKEIGVAKIQNTTIYKKVKSPLPKNEKTLISDLQFVRDYFEKLGLTAITKKINKEIGNKE